MDVFFSPRAQADLEEIADYIAEDSPSRAQSFVDELSQRCLQLADMPLAFPLVPRYRSRGYRRRAFQGYLIFYCIVDNAIEIVRVVHGARDYTRLLPAARTR